ncbi:hypothetical protein ACFQUU_21580 [Herbaspirillum sp. GCM10030257]|uniref:hypothetical protein n=1 Tax=Herbaspirillum sp. GCM10030257 TaxID=3273393 RepID=UPI003620C9DF
MEQEMLSPQQQVLAGMAVRDHHIHAFFPITFLDNGKDARAETSLETLKEKVLDLSVAQLSDRLGWSPDDAKALQEPAWELVMAKDNAAPDFYPHVQQILGRKGEASRLCRAFVLKTPLLRRMKGENNRPQDRLLCTPFRQAAIRRCGVASLDTCIDGARLFAFRTGIAILDIWWHYETDGPLQASAVLEGNYFLSHDNYTENDRVEIERHELSPNLLRSIAQALLPEMEAKPLILHPGRRILYSVVKLDQPTDKSTIRLLALRLGHRQTTDYQPSQEAQGELLQPFPYLCHCSALEGGASVIFDADLTSDYVEHFSKGTSLHIYVPLLVASLHNHFWLLNQTEWIPAHRCKAGSRGESEDLEKIYEQTIEFRRYFHLPMVSHISLHNAFYRHSQETFHIHERLQYVEHTTRDVAELVKTRRTQWLARVSGAIGGFLLTHELLEALSSWAVPDTRVWAVEIRNASPERLEQLVSLVEHWDIGIFCGSILGALLGLWISWHFGTRIKEG